MKKTILSPGSATVINAIATGYGAAFGIGLNIKCTAKTQASSITASNDVGADTKFMIDCAERVFNIYGISTDEFGIDISTKSNLPMASGLSSSSALSNAITKITADTLCEEFGLDPIDDLRLIDIAIESSLEAGVTITGAYDDATASYFGGLILTNNNHNEILRRVNMEDWPILVYIPPEFSNSGSCNVRRMKLLAPLVEQAFEMAKDSQYFKALTLNGLLYSAALDFNSEIAIDALDAGALAAGLSGTGSSFVAICDEDKVDDVKDAWSAFDGRVVRTDVDNIGCRYV